MNNIRALIGMWIVILFGRFSLFLSTSELRAKFQRITHVHKHILGAVAESLERRSHMREIGTLVPSQIKPMTYEIDTCHFPVLVLGINRIGQGLVNSVSQCQDNVTELDLRA